MLDSGTTILLIAAIASAISVLSMYSVYGNVIKHETVLHDLRVRVETLQHQQTLYLAELKGDIGPVVEEAVEAIKLPDSEESILMDDATELVDSSQANQPISSSTKAA